MTTTTKTILSTLFAFTLAACGGSGSSSGRIGAAGGTITTQSGARLDIPAGALSREVEVHLREVEPGNGAKARIEVEPHDMTLQLAARISVKTEDSAQHKLVEIENEVEHGIETERHNELEHAREAAVKHGGTFELRHAAVCATACGAGLECDDGVCKPHGDDAAGVAPNLDGTCDAGLELDDGLCKPHGGANGGVIGTPPVNGTCPAGQELDASDGICKPHGGATQPGGTPPVNGTCPAGMELDASDGICKPHGGGGRGGGN